MVDLVVTLGADIKQMQSQLRAANSSIDKLGGHIRTAAAAFGISFGVDKVLGLGKEVIKVTGEFQRFEAVLTNTLGSNSLAQKALSDIKDFAATTPFEVNELTASFVKLANQGFQPTSNELRKLGDLASSVGKSFDQLTEAIIDAQTGEFERLKEFGIRASKQGDQVKFTFKGVETQTKFTSDAIREYILSLGDLKGVSGSMAAISQTLEGRISNLNDAWGQLLVTIGQGSSGPLFEGVQMLSDMVNTLQLMPAFLEQFKTGFEGLSDKSLDSILQFADTDSGKSVREVLKPITELDNDQFFGNIKQNMKSFVGLLTAEGEEMSEVLTLWKRYVAVRVESTKLNAEQESKNREAAVKKEILEANKRLEAAKELLKVELAIRNVDGSDEAREKRINDFNLSQPNSKLLDQAILKAGQSDLGLDPDPLKISATAEAYMALTQAQLANTSATLDGQQAQLLMNEELAKSIEVGTQLSEMVSNQVAAAIAGQQSAAQALAGIANQVINQYQRMALAAIVKNAAATGKNPIAAIALATIGFTAIKALFAKIGGGGGGGGSAGGGVSSQARAERLTPISVNAGARQEVAITMAPGAGKMFKAEIAKQDRLDNRTKVS